MKKNIVLLVLSLFSINLFAQPNHFIDHYYPGGNIDVGRITEDTIWLGPDVRDTEGSWFYFNFKIRNAHGKKITFVFDQRNVFAVDGPAISKDNGETWSWLKEGNFKNNVFDYSFDEDDKCVQFCTAIPYQQADFEKFVKVNYTDFMVVNDLCTTRHGRRVEKVSIAHPMQEPTYKVLITARHHACEMMASYVVEGLMDAILNDDEFKFLQNHVEFMILPFMDKDGVELGDQGKNRSPRDHNRDYSETSIYASTHALREQIPDWAEEKLKMAIDIHCPWIKGEWNEHIYLVGISAKENENQQKEFCRILETCNKGMLKFDGESGMLPFGTSWNTQKYNAKGQTFKGWANEIEGMSMATTIEFPYSRVKKTQITKENARAFGFDLARAIQTYLQTLNLNTDE